MTGTFVVFEGGEGAGKTTQVERLAEALRRTGHTVTVTREPGGTGIGSAIRDLLLDTWPDGMPAKTEAFLFLADRAAHVEQVIAPALERGEVVVSDRHVDSSVVYQGVGRGLGMTQISKLSRWATDWFTPDLVFVLDIDPQVGLLRAKRHRSHDRIEREADDFHDRVRAGFLRRAELGENHRVHLGTKTRYVVLDATQPPDVLAAAVVDEVAATMLAAVTAKQLVNPPQPAS